MQNINAMDKQLVKIEATIQATIEKTWDYWTNPQHIVNWNAASDDWHTTKAESDLKVGGKFISRMEAKDGSFGFDFEGVFTAVEWHKKIEYVLADARTVKTDFVAKGNSTKIITVFEAETANPVELQKGGWQAILDNFKKYTESNQE